LIAATGGNGCRIFLVGFDIGITLNLGAIANRARGIAG
jgi:hypothetical protein